MLIGAVEERGGLFLGRTHRRVPVLAALHALRVGLKGAVARAGGAAVRGVEPNGAPVTLPEGLWRELSARERAVAALILAGHPNAGIARQLTIAVGTVKHHRHNIYGKLDITTEREMFLQFYAFAGVAGMSAPRGDRRP